MNNQKRFWKDEWAIFIIAGLIIGFLIGKFVPEISQWMKKEPVVENNSTPDVSKTNEPSVLQLSKAQILATAQKNKNKVCVIGIDGATWHVIMPLVNEGKMPNMAKLMNQGVYGNLKSMEPSISPVIWTTIATGKEPAQHGIEGFIVKMPDGYERVPITSDMRKVKAIWNILSDYEKKVGVISWWVTRPQE